MHTVSRLGGRVSDIHNAGRRGNESVSQRFQSLLTVPPPLFKSEFYCIFQLLRSLLSPAILVCMSGIASSGRKSLGLWQQQIEHLSGEKSGGDIFCMSLFKHRVQRRYCCFAHSLHEALPNHSHVYNQGRSIHHTGRKSVPAYVGVSANKIPTRWPVFS